MYYYGLPANLALAAVTTLPAQVLGLEHRIGYIKEGQYTIYHRKRFMNTNHGFVLFSGWDAGELTGTYSHPIAPKSGRSTQRFGNLGQPPSGPRRHTGSGVHRWNSPAGLPACCLQAQNFPGSSEGTEL